MWDQRKVPERSGMKIKIPWEEPVRMKVKVLWEESCEQQPVVFEQRETWRTWERGWATSDVVKWGLAGATLLGPWASFPTCWGSGKSQICGDNVPSRQAGASVPDLARQEGVWMTRACSQRVVCKRTHLEKKKKRILTKLEAAPHALHYSLWSLTASCFTFHYSTRLELVLLKGNAGTSSDVLM